MEPKAHLLVVDDDEANRDMLSRRLERRGFAVDTAAGGWAGLQRVAEGDVDLVLLDIMMPEMDGLEVLRHLRRDHPQSELPVIMVSAKDANDDVVRALDLGANDYITKPITDFSIVVARVQKELRTTAALRMRAEREEDETTSGAVPSPTAPPSTAGRLGPGQVLAERYQLGEPIGSGNFGTVYRGRHLELGLPVAIKVLKTQMGQDEESLARFRAEGRSACLVQHPSAVTVFDFGITDAGVAYMVMELLDGHSLAEELRESERLGPGRLAEIVPSVCAVLDTAHSRGIVHRDVKPENIFLQRASLEGTGMGESQVKVLDFGIAKLIGQRVSEENLTAEGFILGTPAFMAPERLRNQPYDGRSDVYSLGATLYQLLSGRLPFRPDRGDPMAVLMMHLNDEPKPLVEVAADVPSRLAAVVDRCLAKDPAERPLLGEIADTVAAFAGHADPVATAEAGIPSPGGDGSSAIEYPAGGEISDELPTRRLDSSRGPLADLPPWKGPFWRQLWSRLWQRLTGG